AADGRSGAGSARTRRRRPACGRRVMYALPPAMVAGEVVRIQTSQHVVALTFDGGANADAAKRVLSILRREDVPATFFLTGRFVESYPAPARAMGRRYPGGNPTVH